MAMKRIRPKVDPVSRDGVRYQTVFGRRKEFGQVGGVVVAIDEATDAEKWAVVAYRTEYDPAEEADVQDVFITALSVSPDGKELLVENEKGRRFAVSLADRAAREITE